jgi:anti-sigma B factor antagonist
MILATRQVGDTTIVDLDGRLTMGEPAAALRAAIRRELEAGRRKFVINLAGCEFTDSAGMCELATALVRIHNAGGQLRLLKPTKRVQELLRISRLQPVFVLHQEEADALESMT